MNPEKLLRKIKSYSIENIPSPRSKQSFEPQRKKIMLEVGAGVGLHPIQFAGHHPDWEIYAIERTKEKYRKFLNRVEHHNAIKNVHPIHDDAENWVTHLLPDQSVDRLYLLYPNPYPKSADDNKRFINRPFFLTLLNRLKLGATLELRTNIEAYHSEFHTLGTDFWGLEHLKTERLEMPHRETTHFEKKYIQRGERPWRSLYAIQEVNMLSSLSKGK